MSHPMDNYIQKRMIADARRVIELAEHQSTLEHPGLKGRFRELLVDGLLEPWLPPTVQCGTGTVINFRNFYRDKTQEDILLIDRQISPAVLIKSATQEGVYLRNSVLARMEVKSTLEKTHVDDFKKSCDEYHRIGLDLSNEQIAANNIEQMEINVLFAFKSDKKKKTIFSWFNDVVDRKISVVCIPEHGLWKITAEKTWCEYQCQQANLADHPAERLAAFVGLISNMAFHQHIKAQGRNPLDSLEGGIGQYFNHWRLA